MKSKYPKTLLSRHLKALLVPTLFGLSVGSISLGTGCAHQQPQQPKVQEQQQEMITQLQSRLEEVERTNGRLNVRIEELEDQIFLLQDMTESNRIALRRRGYMQRGGYINRNQPEQQAQAQAPGPAPESYYGAASPYADSQPAPRTRQPARSRRKVTRIPLSNAQNGVYEEEQGDYAAEQEAPSEAQASAEVSGEDEEVVITDEQYQQFVGSAPRESKSRASSSGSSGTSSRKAQPPVTDEKLGTSDEGAPSAESAKPEPKKSVAANVDNPLDLYKTALSDYRAGNYADALTNFEAFLNAGPNPNYLDNALYWIGECHYGLGDYDSAVAYFQRVVREQPDGNKVPDAMLKMSLAYERAGNQEESRALLEKLTNRYPTTNAGRLGAQKLSELQN